MQLRESDGIELTRVIATVSPDTRVVILASTADWRVIPAMTSGAAGFLLKDSEPEAIRSAVVAAHLGGQVLCPRGGAMAHPGLPGSTADSPGERRSPAGCPGGGQ